MNSLLLTLGASATSMPNLLVTFIVLVSILAVVAGLIWCIEKWIHPIPAPVKMVLALILVLCVVLWAVTQFWPGALG